MNVTMIARRPSPVTHAAVRAVLAAVAPSLAAACAVAPPLPPGPPLDVHLVLTERWAQGGRLVVVDDAGDRRAVLVAPPPGPPATVRDEQAAFSPDGRWIVFASTRGRDLDHTSLWLVPARPGAAPVQITDGGGGSDISPTFTPDGRAVVFASDRAGTLDLYRLELAPTGRPRARPVRLTTAPSHELAPAIAADGRLAAQVIEPGLAPRSYLALVGADGALAPLTDGPLDATPAWEPSGRRLAFTTVRVRDGGADMELVLLDTLRDLPPVPIADLAATDESGPVFSRDGRWLFATSVALDRERSPLWSSVIVIDLRDPRFVPRMLRDHVGAIVRAGPALAPVRLDELALYRAPLYHPALADALRELDERAAGATSSP